MTDHPYPRYEGRSADRYKRKGISKYIAYVKDPVLKIQHKYFKKFTFDGHEYSNFYHYYNTTWRNERAVEIPIAKKLLDEYQGKNIFEFGNVLKHYFNSEQDVLDKYETSEGIINEDIVGYKSKKKYDLVISISTLEHVGWDERPKHPEKVMAAIESLKGLLSPNGVLFVTFPFGFNQFLDDKIARGEFPFNELKFLKRISANNRWVEAGYHDVKSCKYGEPYRNGNGMIFAYYRNGQKKYFSQD